MTAAKKKSAYQSGQFLMSQPTIPDEKAERIVAARFLVRFGDAPDLPRVLDMLGVKA